MPIVEGGKIMPNGQLALSLEMLRKINVKEGDAVTVIAEDDRVVIMNPLIYAMRNFQKEMAGEFEKAGLSTDEDVIDLVREIRAEIEGL